MKKVIFSLATMVFGLVPTMAQDIADNSIYVNETAAVAGSQAVISVCMKNSAEVQSVGIKNVFLPDGFVVAKDNRDRLMIKLGADRADGHVLSSALHEEDGSYGVAILQSGYPFYGNDGEIFTITVDVDSKVKADTYDVKFEEIQLSGADGVISETAEYIAKIVVAEPTSIQQVMASVKSGEVVVYNANGVLMPAPQKGLNIVKNVKTGEIQKVVIK